jgi:predicted DNA-binding protein
MSDKSERRQINVRLEVELYDFLLKYSKDNYKTVTAVLREIIADLYKESQKIPLVIKNNE